MEKPDELKIPVSEEELERLWAAAKARGVPLEDWVREILLRVLRERDAGD